MTVCTHLFPEFWYRERLEVGPRVRPDDRKYSQPRIRICHCPQASRRISRLSISACESKKHLSQITVMPRARYRETPRSVNSAANNVGREGEWSGTASEKIGKLRLTAINHPMIRSARRPTSVSSIIIEGGGN
jgi:hypothetical protein